MRTLLRLFCGVLGAAQGPVVQAVPWHAGSCWPVSEGFASPCLGQAAGTPGGVGRTPNVCLKSSKRVSPKFWSEMGCVLRLSPPRYLGRRFTGPVVSQPVSSLAEVPGITPGHTASPSSETEVPGLLPRAAVGAASPG